jgi:hypothetical protein
MTERLHGGTMRFKPGRAGLRRDERMFHEEGWEGSLLRCLHMCFVRRSSRDRRPGARPNLVDLAERPLHSRARAALPPKRVGRKVMGYAKGELLRSQLAPSSARTLSA